MTVGLTILSATGNIFGAPEMAWGGGVAGQEEVQAEVDERRGETEEAVAQILNLMEVFLAFLAVLLTLAGLVGVIGFFESRSKVLATAKKALEPAEAATAAAKQASLEAQIASQRAAVDAEAVAGLRKKVEADSTEITRAIAAPKLLAALSAAEAQQVLIDAEAGQVIGVASRADFAELAWLKDDDTRLLVLDLLARALRLDPVFLSEGFTVLGRYWRLLREFSRARARLVRALELNPENATAHLQLAKTLIYDTAAHSRERLDEADRALNRAAELLGGATWEILAEQGLIQTFHGDLEGAIMLYRRARQALLTRPDPAASPIRVRNITYNLAGTLSRAGRFEESLAELAQVVGHDRNWEAVEQDPDFKPLLESALQDRLATLIEEARSGAGGEPEGRP